MAVNENSHNLIGIVRQKELLKKENDTEKNAIICTDILSEKIMVLSNVKKYNITVYNDSNMLVKMPHKIIIMII